MLHFERSSGVRVEHVITVSKVISENQIRMAIAVYVGENCGIRIPNLTFLHDLQGRKCLCRKCRIIIAEKYDWRSTPIIDYEIHPAVLVHVGREAPHGSDGARIVSF